MWARCLRVLLDRVLHAQPVSWRVAPHDAPRLFLRASHAKPTARWHQEPRARFGNGLDFIDAALKRPIARGYLVRTKGSRRHGLSRMVCSRSSIRTPNEEWRRDDMLLRPGRQGH